MHATPNQHLHFLVAQWVRAQMFMLEYSSLNPTQGTIFFFYPVATHSPISDNLFLLKHAQWVRAQISMLEYSSSNPTQGTSFFFFTYILSGSYSRPYFGHFFYLVCRLHTK